MTTNITLIGPNSVTPGVSVNYTGVLTSDDSMLILEDQLVYVIIDDHIYDSDFCATDGSFSFNIAFAVGAHVLKIGSETIPGTKTCVESTVASKTVCVDCFGGKSYPTGTVPRPPYPPRPDGHLVSSFSRCRSGNTLYAWNGNIPFAGEWHYMETKCLSELEHPIKTRECNDYDVIERTCLNGATGTKYSNMPIVTHRCYDGVWVDTGWECPEDIPQECTPGVSVQSYNFKTTAIPTEIPYQESIMHMSAQVAKRGNLIASVYSLAYPYDYDLWYLMVLNTTSMNTQTFPLSLASPRSVLKGLALTNSNTIWAFERLLSQPYSVCLVRWNLNWSTGIATETARYDFSIELGLGTNETMTPRNLIGLRSGGVAGAFYKYSFDTGTSTMYMAYVSPAGQVSLVEVPEDNKTLYGCMIQHPADDSIWSFGSRDGMASISATHATETSDGLVVDWFDPGWVSIGPIGHTMPDGWADVPNDRDEEMPPIVVAEDPIHNKILLSYIAGTNERVCTQVEHDYGPCCANKNQVIIMSIAADRRRSYLKLPYFLERVDGPFAPNVMPDGSIHLLYNPITTQGWPLTHIAHDGNSWSIPTIIHPTSETYALNPDLWAAVVFSGKRIWPGVGWILTDTDFQLYLLEPQKTGSVRTCDVTGRWL